LTAQRATLQKRQRIAEIIGNIRILLAEHGE
jgi:hypothetical protein